MDTLSDLVDALIATDQFPTSWAYQLDGEDGAYLDCSDGRDGSYRLEIGDGDDTVQLDLSLPQLREIHRQLTLQLAVITRQQNA